MTLYRCIGIMSGTSLDGLDIAYCTFKNDSGGWTYEILFAETCLYTDEWKKRLSGVMNGDALSIAVLHSDFGHFIGQKVNEFIRKNKIGQVDMVSSHGHTVFHQPEKKLTLQIGDGAAIAAETGLTTVCDFRTLDVALGGQGAPLVPIGDKLLFPGFDLCLNLGGIANSSFETDTVSEEEESNRSMIERIAFDICPCNLALNFLAKEAGKEFDEGGKLASSGKISQGLLEELNELEFYRQAYPKSLGREWVERLFIPILETNHATLNDKLRTVCEHIAIQVSKVVNRKTEPGNGSLLITGGGAFNSFLVERIKSLSKVEIVLPEANIIHFKEALIFAFLGVLRMRGEVNTLRSVTGASRDSCGGAIYMRDPY